MTYNNRGFVNQIGSIIPTSHYDRRYYYPYPLYTYEGFTDNQFELKPISVNESTQTISPKQLNNDSKRFKNQKRSHYFNGNSVIEQIKSENFPLKYTIVHICLLFICSFILIIIQMGLNFKGVIYANVFSGYWVNIVLILFYFFRIKFFF